VAGGSVHYHVLFLVGILLFLISLAVNLAGASVVFRARTRAERILA
jgi:phosphate transport system permease protein